MINLIAAENAEATSFSAIIGGKKWSGITEHSRFWGPLQAAISEGAEVEPYVAPPQEKPALAELAKLDRDVDRVTEDLIDALISKGVITAEDMPAQAMDKINQKKALRAQL